MTSNRPNPIQAADMLRSLIEAWKELDSELTRIDGKASRGKTESKAPLNLEALDASRTIDTFARTYCHKLAQDPKWRPRALNTGALIQSIIDRIGHFTHSDDAELAYEFIQDLENVHRHAWAVARPDGKARIPIGHCFQDGCTGKLRVLIDRDRPLDPSSLTMWRPNAKCDADDGHVIDARLYAAQRGKDTPVTE